MEPSYSGWGWGEVIQFVFIGFVCIFYNKSIARELARIYLTPIRWIFGERPWVNKSQQYFTIWARFTLYGIGIMSILFVVFTVAGIYHVSLF